MTRTFYVRIPLLALALLPFTLSAAVAQPECWEDATIAGALPDQPAPVFCSINTQGPDTSKQRPVRFRDTFQHGLSFADFEGTAYTIFDSVDDTVFDSIHWRHSEHWMVDIAPAAPGAPIGPEKGGSMLSPNGTYNFRNGKLSIEATFAAGHEDYVDLGAWGEIVISTGDDPLRYREGSSAYAYEMFPGSYTLGCRLQEDRHTICSLMDDSNFGSVAGGRIWEMSFFQVVGETNQGGFPGNYDPEVFRVCESGVDPDTECRDHFRLELTSTSLAIFVNGKKYFEQTGIPALPAELMDGDLYIYFASMIGRLPFDVVRFHWDGIAVNAHVPIPDEFDPAIEPNGKESRSGSVRRTVPVSAGPVSESVPIVQEEAIRATAHRFERKSFGESPEL